MPGSEPVDETVALRARLRVAEAKAAQLEQWLDLAIEASPIAMGIVSTFENRYVRANTHMARLCGMSLEQLLAADPYSMAMALGHPDELVAEQKLFAELASGARPSYQIEKRYMRPDGSYRWGQLTFSGIFDDPVEPEAKSGPLRFVVLQVVDVTEQRAMAEAFLHHEEELRHAQKIDGLGRLAAGIAHDFNNLLTVITGHGEVLKSLAEERARPLSGEDLLEDLEAILAASDRAASLTAQLLAHGRRETVMPRTFVLSEVVAMLQRLLSRTLGSNIEVNQSLKAVGSILADPGHIGQVVMNLILNARDAMPDGGRIQLSTRDVDGGETVRGAPLPGPGRWVALIVSDTGHGISPEVRARMFEPFFTTRTDRPGTQGTGLGLSTVQRIVAEAGGHIEVSSTLGEGTAFTVLFPRVTQMPSPVELVQAQRRPAPLPNSQRVLVIEDEPSVRALVATVLLGAHYWVTVARDGQEALRFIEAEQKPFHLIVSDLMMPALSGASLAQLLSASGNSPRMLFISGYSNHTPAELLPYGNLLPKPFTPAQLLAAVRHTLEEPS